MHNHRLLRYLSVLSLAGSLFGLPDHAHAQLKDLGSIDSGTDRCTALATNASGSVTGVCRDAGGHEDSFFVAHGAAMRQLTPLASGKPCNVEDINDSNGIAGNCEIANSGEVAAVRWPLAGAPQRLQPGLLEGNTHAIAINSNGAVVGSESSGGKTDAVLWLGSSTAATALPEPGLLGLGVAGCEAKDLNDNVPPVVIGSCRTTTGVSVAVSWSANALGGYAANQLPAYSADQNCTVARINAGQQVAGTCEDGNGGKYAVRWPNATGGAPIALTSSPDSDAVWMNAQGLITGNFDADGNNHAFFWNPNNGNFFDIGTLGGANSSASDINGGNQVVGISETDSGTLHAFSWTAAGGIADVSTLGGANSGASDVSDSGYITGDSETSDGHLHAFINK